jgi:hypothetical protein
MKSQDTGRGDEPRRARRHLLEPLLDRVVVWEWDSDADRVVASATLPHIYGVPALERVSQGMTLVHPDDLDAHQARVHAAVDRGRGYRSSFRIVRPDTGDVAVIDERAEAIPRRSTQPPLIIGVAFDATDRGDAGHASATDGFDAFDQFCDVMLQRYASNLRQHAAEADAVSGGHWIKWASREFDRLRAMPMANVRTLKAVLKKATAAMRGGSARPSAGTPGATA